MVFKEKKESFANSPASISDLLLIDDGISKKGSFFEYDDIKFKVNIVPIESSDQKNNYFDITLYYEGSVDDSIANKITSLHRAVISILKRNFQVPPKVLWSDLDSYYSTKAYPLIKNIENLMRKVLTKLFIVKVGYSWEKTSLSADLKGKAGNSKGRNIEANYLSGLDFIDLTLTIFDKYSATQRDLIFDEIDKACKAQDLSKIESILPRSNWQRYLSEHIDCTEEVLIDKWKELYDIRCAVAHNTGFTKGDFENCLKLTGFIEKVLSSSLENIEKEVVESDIDSSRKEPASEVIYKAKSNETDLQQLKTLQKNIANLASLTSNNDMIRKQIEHLSTFKNPYEDVFKTSLDTLRKLQVHFPPVSTRNNWMHGVSSDDYLISKQANDQNYYQSNSSEEKNQDENKNKFDDNENNND